MLDLNLKQYPLITTYDKENNTGIFKSTVHLDKIFQVLDKKNSFLIPRNDKKFYITTNLKKQNGYFLEILFHGLNFNAKRVKLYRPKYFVDVHKSEVFVCDETASNEFKSHVHKRRLIFFSYDKHLLHNISRKIKEFRLPDIYTGKGLLSRDDQFKTKPGKIR
jgi:hypothetical protein